ncbi:MAG: hypothetical protein KBC43_11955 [Bacteroidales bacterium]|nr:hypothetical protein [Bacteroidales bacterium]
MISYISYFDLLGFKKFILNNDSEYIQRRIGHILRDIEMSMGQGEFTRTSQGVIANISNFILNCLNISDTIIFWTNNDSLVSFNELLKVSFYFNYKLTCYHFPVRGAILFDEIDLIAGFQETQGGGSYNVNSIFGKGLVKAHLKAESLNFASCIIDNSVSNKLIEYGDVHDIYGDYAMKYQVPYKNGVIIDPEYVLKFYINKSITEQAFRNRASGIQRAFENDNKGMDERSEILLNNTIDFLGALLEYNQSGFIIR